MMDKDKLEWLESIGAKRFDEPMVYYVEQSSGFSMLYSEKYLQNTSLEELKALFGRCGGQVNG